jgi:hypothetical protein
MISQQDISEYIEKEMPELSDVCSKEKSRTVYDVVWHMLKYTKSQVIRHNLNAAKKCMVLAEKLYHKGNNAVKNAIENVFVYSFSHAFFHDADQMKEVLDIVPPSLYKLYRNQVINSHL